MANATFSRDAHTSARPHPFGAHGMLLALPISVALWLLIALPFM